MPTPIYNPAPGWISPRNQHIYLYHGCTTVDKVHIERHGIDLSKCRVDTDFGRGFYTTTVKYQAQQLAWNRFYDPAVKNASMNQPVVLAFRVDRHDLSKLWSIGFILADLGKEEFWSLVQHCRQSTPTNIRDHHGPVHLADGTNWYDVAGGTVAAFWRQRYAMQDADQISFHSPQGVNLLNHLIDSGDKQQYSGEGLE